MANDWHLIEFFTPIVEYKENIKEGYDDFIIKGVAINETTTHNGHKYIAEELQKASAHLIGKKLLVDHRNEVDAIKGTINKSWWNEVDKRIEFEGNVKDKTIREMIRDGRLSDVSIGAYATDLVKEEDGSMTAKGLNIVELSFVAVPADSKANFGMAMANNFNIKESLSEAQDLKKCPECGKMIPKDKMKQHMADNHADDMDESLNHESGNVRRYKMEENKIAEMEEANKKLTESNQKAMEELAQLRNEKRQHLVNEYKKLCSEKKVTAKEVSKYSDETVQLLMEQLKDVVVAETQMRSQVSTEDYSGISNVMIERTDKGGAIWEMPNADKIRQLHNNLPFRVK